MLRILLLSLLWAICSTCLVRPWFWGNIIKKQFLKDNEERIGFSKGFWKVELCIEIVLFFAMFFGSVAIYYYCGFRQNFWGSLSMIVLCIILSFGKHYGTIKEKYGMKLWRQL